MKRVPTAFLLLAWVLVAFFTILPAKSFSQVKNFDFEKITPADFNLSATSDTTADAVVIADVGRTHFEYGTKGFFLLFERRTRVRILKPGGTRYASIVIPLYRDGSDMEKVTSFKGSTYNLVNGEVVRTKVKNDDIFQEGQSANWVHQKIAMPAVTANSIIEFEYAVNSDFLFNLQPWTFQDEIPVNWSEYNVLIPEYFVYKNIAQGNVPFAVSDIKDSKQRFEVRVESQLGVGTGANAREAAHTDVYEPLATEYRWVAQNVPAFRPEPFMTTTKDYISTIEFELSTLKFPGEQQKNVLGNWEKINEKLLEDEDFGRVVKKGGFIADQLPLLLAGRSSVVEKTQAIFDAVKARMKWNGNYGIFVTKSPKKTWEERSGSAADINMMMIAILNEAGIRAEPVILSTRSHGKIVEMYPILSKFNYVVAHVPVDTVSYLLDASSSVIPFNTLPERCLNGNGRIISKENPGWIHLANKETKKELLLADLKLEADGALSGTCTVNSSGLYGNDRRNAFLAGEEKELLREFSEKHRNWTAAGLRVANLDSLGKSFNEVYTVSMPSGIQVAGDRMYFNVMLDLGQNTNPFRLEKREFPVDFSCPVTDNALVRISLPDGWTVEQLPKPAMVALPDKAATFRFLLQELSGTIQVSSVLTINKSMFSPDEYEHLKEFFRLIVAKHAEQVVLKRSGS